MTMGEPRVTDWDERQAFLNGFTARIRQIAPGDRCIHDAPACLSCSLERVVAESIPIFLLPPQTRQVEVSDRELISQRV